MTYVMSAEENYDAARVAYIAALTTYTGSFLQTDQNYQGVQWDPVRRNLMYLYAEKKPSTPATNTTGHTLWDGAVTIAPSAAVNSTIQFNSSIGVKNIDTGVVTFNLNYNVAKVVPNGIGGSDGTFRRFTREFSTGGGSGPGMTDPYTGNFWINSQSCQLYCFRLSDNYAQVISPLFPIFDPDNDVMIVGFVNTGASGPWSLAREIDISAPSPHPVYLHLTPRLFTATETTADYLLAYATFTYPTTWTGDNVGDFHAYNREVFDNAGNMYLFSCAPSGGKGFKLYKFHLPTSATYGGSTIGGGFTDITPWGISTGPNADAATYTLLRDRPASSLHVETAAVIPMYLPDTDDLVLIEKFFPSEKTASSTDPALMSWSCTYVHSPATSPTLDHHSAFVTGYMAADWTPTNITGAAYAVIDAFEVNSYLDQSDYAYDMDYTTRWFGFVCTKMSGEVSDESPRVVLVEYQFNYGTSPSVTRVVDEQGWDDAYPTFGPFTSNAYSPYTDADTAAVAASITTSYNDDFYVPRWDVGVFDPETNSFWWSGGGTDLSQTTPFWAEFDPAFADRMKDNSGVPGGDNLAASPPFMKLTIPDEDTGGDDEEPTDDSVVIRVWGFSLDGHDFYVLRLGPSQSLIYDLTTSQWAEWATPNRDNWRAHCGQNWVGMSTATFANGFGSDVVCGDDASGTLWILDPNSGIDDRSTTGSDAFTRMVIGGIPLAGRDTIPCGAVQLTCSLGNPALTGASITLRTSDDFGNSYVDHGAVTTEAGTFDQVVEWRSLGLIRQPGRVFELSDNGAAVRISGLDMR